jgi:hypothetical protein
MFFEGVQTAKQGPSAALGWTETYYTTTQALSLDGLYLDPSTQSLLQLRRDCLDNHYRISFVRINDADNPHAFKVFTPDGFVGGIGTPASKFPQVQCAVLADLMKLPAPPDVHAHHRRFLLRGLGQDVVNGNVLNTAGVSWPAITAFFNYLAQAQAGTVKPQRLQSIYGLRYQNTAAFVGRPTGIQNNPADGVSILANMPGMPIPAPFVPFQVRIKGVQDERRLNKTWTCVGLSTVPATNNWLILEKLKHGLQSYTYTNTGLVTATQVIWSYSTFDQYTIMGLRSKKTGRLFHQPRGRSPVRV